MKVYYLGLAAALTAGALALSRRHRARRAIDFAGRVVVIIGGSRGLGLVMAREFAAEDAHVVLVARDPETLQRAALDLSSSGGRVTTFACDVTDRFQVERTIDDIFARHHRIDVLVNDAGIIEVGPVEHMTDADFERAMATHFWGPLWTIRTALPYMHRAGARRIVNIASIGGRLAVPHLVPYTASKFALTGLSEGLRAELSREGFRVTTVCPGLMRTGSTYNASFKGQHRREFAWFHTAASTPGLSISAERAARRIVDACRHGDPDLTLTPAARLAVALNALCPTTMARLMNLSNSLLPRATDVEGDRARPGWQSVSRLVPSPLTRLSDRAAVANNEVHRAAQGAHHAEA